MISSFFRMIMGVASQNKEILNNFQERQIDSFVRFPFTINHFSINEFVVLKTRTIIAAEDIQRRKTKKLFFRN